MRATAENEFVVLKKVKGLGSGREGPPGEGAAGGRRALPEGACGDRIPILSRCRAQSSSGGSGGSEDARPLPV